MNIPIEIVAAVAAVLLGALISAWINLSKRMNKLDRTVLTIVIMLRDRGFRVPDPSDTDRLLRNKGEGI